MDTPYEYYDSKLGVKIKFITTDRCHVHSLKLISYRSLKWRIDSKTSPEKQLRRGQLNLDSLILFSSLSREFKDCITTKFGHPKEEIKKSWFAQHYVADRKAFDFFVAHRYGKNNQEKLDLKFVEQYTYNASVMNAVLDVKINRKAYAKALGGVKIDIWQSLSNDVNAFHEVPHNLPSTKDGLRRKVTKYAKALKEDPKAGYKTIISGRLQNSNAKKATTKEQMALLDELIAKHTNLGNELIASIYNVVAEKMNWKTMTAMTVSNRKKANHLVTHAGRNGVRSLYDKELMQVKRSRPSSSMLYWTLDGWDVELLYQATSVDKKGNKVTTYHNRLTVVVILDAQLNYPIGYAIGTHETPQLIKKALQNAIQHSKQLFGDFYMPYQLQSDRYSIKKLTPLYKSLTHHFTPAKAKNSKSKVIEPYFGILNSQYCKLLNNWSGHNVDSGSKNQPNTEYLNKIRHTFPDKAGVINQIESIIYSERNKKGSQFANNWLETDPEHKQIMTHESYLLTFGSNTGYTNRLTGEGLKITIEGQKYWYDSFDINFRHKSYLDWEVRFDENDLSKVLAVSTDGSERFILEQKYIQPMALADRVEGDAEQLKLIGDFNQDTVQMITNQRIENADILEEFLETPALNDTLAKHLLTNSHGQHKNLKSQQRLEATTAASKIVEKEKKKIDKKKAKTFADEQEAYYASKVNINKYL
jgi:hypothetical protein